LTASFFLVKLIKFIDLTKTKNNDKISTATLSLVNQFSKQVTGQVYTNRQEGCPGTVVTGMATELFSSKYSQCQLSEAEPVEYNIYRNITIVNKMH